ncbi:DivIVA protein [Antricoccus suffuscus]|uniref:DivIVA protein n=1 Tax=Antricoccus suffuscus TaxID=1629062 RepID=A0A2T1A497_9ACTN|nr:DivIVA domain-containing protein [Antricoccus suffuscus]PRZ43419.1 DivIVA protein [Antricoccus suffuscus]
MNSDNPQDLIPLGAPPIGFDVVMRGYDRNQVQDAIGRLEDDLRTVVSERDQAISRANDLHVQLEQASSDVTTLNSKLRNAQAPTFESMGERIASMLRLAEEEAAEIRRAATADADEIRANAEGLKAEADEYNTTSIAASEQALAEARAEADRVLGEAKSEAAKHTEDRHREADDHLTKAKDEAQQLRTSTNEEIAALVAHSESTRAQADEDFEIALRERRTEAQRIETERDRNSRAEADNRLRVAKETAHNLVTTAQDRSATLIANAEAEVHHIKTVRASVAAHLAEIRTIVAQVPANLAEYPDPLPPRELTEQREREAASGTGADIEPSTSPAADEPAPIDTAAGDESEDAIADEHTADEAIEPDAKPADVIAEAGDEAVASETPVLDETTSADESTETGAPDGVDAATDADEEPSEDEAQPKLPSIGSRIPDEDIPASERTVQLSTVKARGLRRR